MAIPFRGDSAGSSPARPQVKPLLPAPARAPLRDRRLPVVAAGPRRILVTTSLVTAFVIAAAAGLRLAADPLARSELLDLLVIPAEGSYPGLAAIGVALLVGVATLASLSRSARR